MKFRETVDSPCGVRFCFEALSLSSGFARKFMLDSEMMTDERSLAESFAMLESFVSLVRDHRGLADELQSRLASLRDISGTIASLRNGHLLDDIELFEIKHLAMLGNDVNGLLPESLFDALSIDFDRIIDVLDPDGLRIGTFYIYDSYSPVLREARSRLEKEPDNEAVREEVICAEDDIRMELGSMLRPWADSLNAVMHTLASIDIYIAKARLMLDGGYCIPDINQGGASFEAMFHPEVKTVLREKGGEFQNIDFEYYTGNTSTIIGANMGGKTLVLKSLCLAQYLFQFGFAVPAARARMMVFDNIRLCVGDLQSQRSGLSSFAAEMLSVNEVIDCVERGGMTLALVDEPARTTNPVEGSALVSALLRILGGKDNLALVLTTHYEVDYAAECWKVRGLVKTDTGMKMDYFLEKSSSNDVPREALNIAGELNINAEWIKEASSILEHHRVKN